MGNYDGNDLHVGGYYGRVIGHMKSVEECRIACLNVEDCVGFTFVKSEKEKDNCAVKSVWDPSTKRTNTSCCDSGRVTDDCRKYYQGDSIEGCGLAVMDKCYEHNPPDGSSPGNLIEEIGAVSNATTCQQFCKDLYPTTCGWFMYDRTTNDCKLFKGALSELEKDCTESGYAIRPSYDECKVANVETQDGCYNFREDYCRFEFSLLDNLESIQTIQDCQKACQYLTNCTFFIYDAPSKICKLNTDPLDKRICDIVHGSKEPSLQKCLDDEKIQWAK